MKIQQKDYYHGAALTQIVEHYSFKALNKADAKYGHYKINNNIRLMIKITSGEESPWQFTVNKSDIDVMKEDISSVDSFFLCLVCGLETICILTENQITELLNLTSEEQQWIKVRKTGSLRASSRLGELKQAIAQKAYPDILFD